MELPTVRPKFNIVLIVLENAFSNVAEIGENVFGGYSLKADSKNNEVTINGGSVVTANVAGGVTVKGSSEGNTVRIIKSSAANVYGGKGDTSSKENNVEIATLTLPKNKAAKMAELLVNNGVKAIWNFAHVDLNVPEDVIVENVHLSDSLMKLSYGLGKKSNN